MSGQSIALLDVLSIESGRSVLGLRYLHRSDVTPDTRLLLAACDALHQSKGMESARQDACQTSAWNWWWCRLRSREAAAEDQCLEEQTPDPSKIGVNNTKKRTDTGLYKIWHSLHPGLRWAIVMPLSPPAAIVWAFILGMWVLGMRRLLWDRQWVIGAENQWSFGQVLQYFLSFCQSSLLSKCFKVYQIADIY